METNKQTHQHVYIVTTGPLQWEQCRIWEMSVPLSILFTWPISDRRVMILCAVTPGILATDKQCILATD